MKLVTLIEKLNKVKPGTYFRLKYESDGVAVSASAKKQGYEVVKVTSATVRSLVNYYNMKSVKDTLTDKQETNSNEKKEIYENVKTNAICRHIEKGTEYLRVVKTFRHAKTAITEYIVKFPDNSVKVMNKEELQQLQIVNNSYWNRSNDNTVFNVKVENILDIHNKNM